MTTNLAEHDTDVAASPDADPAAPIGAAAGPQTYPYILRGVDPRTVRAEGNSRVVGDIRERRPELVASVVEHGVDPKISMISVAPHPDDGVLDVLVGFHRHAAAVAVKEVENPDLTITLVVHEPGTRRDVLVAQGIENIHRAGYTQAEEAGLYEQLSLAGVDDDEDIAKALARPVERVRAGRAVAAAPLTRAASEARPELDLLELGQMLEFEDDPQDHQVLLDFLTHNPNNFEWKAEQVRKNRQRRAMQTEEEARLLEQGYALISEEQDPADESLRLDELCNGENLAPLDAAGHADCPGRAVAVEVNYRMDVKVIHFCLDYAAYGHHSIVAVKSAAAEGQLREQGIEVLANPYQPATARAVENLFADESAERTMTPEEHAECPGHAAYVETDPHLLDVDVVYVCTDPAAHGHVQWASSAAQPERDAAFRARERKRAEVNNKAWREAKEARRAWLAKFFTGWRKKKPADLPARVHHWLALAPMLASDFLKEAAPAHSYACTLLKLAEPEGYKREANPLAVHLRKKTCTESQAVLIRLAQVIGACEAHWDHAYTAQADSSWRSPSDDSRYYFELLDTLGYPLEHVEQLINNPDLDNDRWSHLAPDTEPADDSDTADDADSEEDNTPAA